MASYGYINAFITVTLIAFLALLLLSNHIELLTFGDRIKSLTLTMRGSVPVEGVLNTEEAGEIQGEIGLQGEMYSNQGMSRLSEYQIQLLKCTEADTYTMTHIFPDQDFVSLKNYCEINNCFTSSRNETNDVMLC